eukprot:gene1357-1498_t
MKELEKLIEEIKELVEQQFHDQDDAIFERGPYKLRKDLLSVATVAKKGAEMNLSKETCAVVKDKHNLVIPHIVDDE